MSKYLLIESRDPFESQDVRYFYELSPALELIGRDAIPALFRGFDHIWHW